MIVGVFLLWMKNWIQFRAVNQLNLMLKNLAKLYIVAGVWIARKRVKQTLANHRMDNESKQFVHLRLANDKTGEFRAASICGNEHAVHNSHKNCTNAIQSFELGKGKIELAIEIAHRISFPIAFGLVFLFFFVSKRNA